MWKLLMEKHYTRKTPVLIIEDEDTQRRLLQEHLELLDFSVESAENGEEGLEILHKNPDIRIVITDLKMPVMDGFEVLKITRETELRHTYIMVLTSMDDKKSLLKGLSLGADDYVSKPVIKEELKLRLQAAIRLLRLEDHNKLVYRLAEIMARRSGELALHLKKTKLYCWTLANDLHLHHPELGLSRQDVEDIANISIMHDIGKISIPAALLQKRGRYSPKEYELIKEHPIVGAKILEELHGETGSTFLKFGHELILGHHEKWDGSGYPNGLKGEEIPLAARIMAFADAYDAVCSPRHYKDPLSPEHAESKLVAEKGKHFDPLIIEAFVRTKDVFANIHETYPDPDRYW